MFPMCHPCLGLAKQDSDEIGCYHKGEVPVYLNVYDMYKLNEYTGNLGLGVFHSGVEVYGIEYGYGGHEHNTTGIFDMVPRDEQLLEDFFNIKGNVHFKERIRIGFTTFTRPEIEQIKNKLGKKFKGNRYHLIHNNCNHFSGAFTKALCKKGIPNWVNRLANVGSCIPFLVKIIPNDMLGPGSYHLPL